MADRVERSIAIGGVRYVLVEDADVRAADLAGHRATLRRLADGETVVLEATDLMMPPLASGDRIAAADRLELRELIEEILDRGFDERWVEAIAEFVSRHRMLRTGR